jgi:hypothetical protein
MNIFFAFCDRLAKLLEVGGVADVWRVAEKVFGSEEGLGWKGDTPQRSRLA